MTQCIWHPININFIYYGKSVGGGDKVLLSGYEVFNWNKLLILKATIMQLRQIGNAKTDCMVKAL